MKRREEARDETPTALIYVSEDLESLHVWEGLPGLWLVIPAELRAGKNENFYTR